MPQFDIYRLPDGEWVVDVQSGFVTEFNTRVVVPLISPDADASAIARLNPTLRVADEDRLLAPQLIATVPTSVLGIPIDSLADHDAEIKAALDVLIYGI